MPATVYRGTQATITNGPTELNIESWTAWVEEPAFPVHAEGETAQTTVAGDPIGRMIIRGSVNGNTIPSPGDAINATLKTNSSGTSYTNNWRCVSVRWEKEGLGGGPPQILRTEWITTDTAAGTGILP